MDLFTAQVDFEPSRKAGLDRLARFVPKAGTAYAKMRNHDFGPDNRSNVSALSPYISTRLVLEEEVLRDVLAVHRPDHAGKFIDEVFWRSYWKGWLELRPSVYAAYEDERDHALALVQADDALKRDVDAALDGATGIDCFDFWVRELKQTGYLHNHARMWFASIFIFTLRLPWTIGADFFLRHLLDGDPASNTLSWRWVAGLHTRGKTYLARADNIMHYTGGRFAPNGLANSAVPIEGAPPPPARLLAPAGKIGPDQPFFAILTSDDCSPESLFPSGLPLVGVASVATRALSSPLALSPVVREFEAGALEDAATRFLEVTGQRVEKHDAADMTALASRIVASGARVAVMAWPCTGPSLHFSRSLELALRDHGVVLVRLRRDWDSRAWPHATRGFFAFREGIPDLLGAAGLPAYVAEMSRRLHM